MGDATPFIITTTAANTTYSYQPAAGVEVKIVAEGATPANTNSGFYDGTTFTSLLGGGLTSFTQLNVYIKNTLYWAIQTNGGYAGTSNTGFGGIQTK